jgi:hypothetical protein
MPHVRFLHDPSVGKTWTARLDGATTEVRKCVPGRERISTRDHDDAEAAHRWVVKEEWARLKKGMVLLDPNAAPGAPRLHRFVGGPYTGAMAIAPVDDGGFVCNRFAEPDGERSAGSDEMVHVGPDGGITAGFMLPVVGLVWKAARVPDTDAVLLQVDGGIVRWGLGAGTAEEILPYRPTPGFLGVGGDRLAGYDGADVVVLDLNGGAELLRIPARAELHGGHSSKMEGTLSGDGRLLALCARPGEITIFDVASGKPRLTLRGDFVMVRQMEFLPDGHQLLVAENYGRWSLRCLDLSTGQPVPDWTELRIDGGAVALSPSGDRVAVARRDRISIHDLGQNGRPRGFALEHTVKRCAMAWIADDALAVRTDLGCASIYAVP